MTHNKPLLNLVSWSFSWFYNIEASANWKSEIQYPRVSQYFLNKHYPASSSWGEGKCSSWKWRMED